MSDDHQTPPDWEVTSSGQTKIKATYEQAIRMLFERILPDAIESLESDVGFHYCGNINVEDTGRRIHIVIEQLTPREETESEESTQVH